MHNNLYEQKSCPLCGNQEYTSISSFEGPKNSYAEIISHILNLSPDQLYQALKPSQCSQCEIVYFRCWFTSSIRDKLYQEKVPNHPAGWKTFNKDKLFNYKYFQQAFENYSHNPSSINKRILLEYLNSMSYDGITPIEVNHLLLTHSLSELRESVKPELFSHPPRAFSKYSMFSSEYLIKKVSQSLSLNLHSCKYAEIGCPLWGFLPSLVNHNSQLHHFLCNHDFWGTHCMNEDLSLCSEQLPIKYHYLDDIDRFDDYSFDCICAFASLDHFPDLGQIIKNVLRIARKVVIYNESCTYSSIPPIQHICNLDTHSLVKYFNSSERFEAELIKIDDTKYSSLAVIGHKNEKN